MYVWFLVVGKGEMERSVELGIYEVFVVCLACPVRGVALTYLMYLL